MIEMDGKDIKRAMWALKRAMATGAGGKTIKRDVSKRLRGVIEPLADRMRTKVRSLPSKGHSGPSMRQAVARQIKAATRWSGENTGVSVVQRARSMPRDFRMAGRAFNREEGWHPQTLGGVTVHQQVRPAQWFDSETNGERAKATRAISEALEDAAVTIAKQAKR